ncbi:hypothetical protein SCLCIDRAFT_1209019 [Scleroderma citrinum Foug A]|uniref:Uncharacterized protein n=1 Tax=Scleroderma citrinum Foug A TaxID=1036808 RepID=A0A0C3A553_9AGAM|nr:hypothetical protein SCLCIDRAFT_1209019 [Scleroderma citrinum Foug A]
MLLPHISKVVDPSGSSGSSNSSTVNTALTHRIRLLQEENDELYDVLRHGETGKLKEEVRGLRQVVDRLEGALRESHQVVTTLSAELDKSYQTFHSSLRQKHHPNAHAHPYAPPHPPPRDTFHPHQHHQSIHPHGPSVSNGLSKPPPTGPRAHKKPRLAPEANIKMSPAHSSVSLPPPPSNPVNSTKHPPPQAQAPTQPAPIRNEASRSPHIPPSELRAKGTAKMEIEEDSRTRPRMSQERDREKHRDKDWVRERVRDRDRDREKDRDRERERERFSKRNGTGSGAGGGSRGRNRGGFSHPYAGGDRTLAERMGL